MNASHMLKYHLLIPAAIFAALVVVGVPLGNAFFVGMMAGCMGMMLMMMGGTSHRPREEHDETPRETRADSHHRH